MPQALIKIAYKQVIDINSKSSFEKDVFNDTYSEFLMQVQSYNSDNQYTTWDEIRTNVPKGGFNVPYKVGFAIGLYVRDLKNQIPYLLDSLGRKVAFENYKFEIIASDIINKAAHKVSLTYETDTLTLFGMAGEYLLLALGDQTATKEPVETFMLKMQSNFSVVSYLAI